MAGISWLLLLPLAVACISWTVTKEEIFHEWRTYCQQRSKQANSILVRKFFYLFTCEYCFSHWVALFMVGLTGYRLLLPDYRGLIVAVFAVIMIANFYMTIYSLIRASLRFVSGEADIVKEELKD
jgi:hypothetical protein